MKTGMKMLMGFHTERRTRCTRCQKIPLGRCAGSRSLVLGLLLGAVFGVGGATVDAVIGRSPFQDQIVRVVGRCGACDVLG
ncbi:hypothetical protein GCM10011399_14760 [Subtercola lobariae]|uniref:Uncharacterized protein n=1 Tax=Subtercola lobariae TaxID=1588641 RepID=A0A917B446_9MICO|nr:hypothetical protein GCM10011399_14760 [Subtercola lobariae]